MLRLTSGEDELGGEKECIERNEIVGKVFKYEFLLASERTGS